MKNTAARIETANEIKAKIDRTKPVTDWHMTTNLWTTPDNGSTPGHVRIYVNDGKKPAAIITVEPDGSVRAEWKPGHSLTRNELAKALQLSVHNGREVKADEN